MKNLLFCLAFAAGLAHAEDVVMFNDVVIGGPLTLAKCATGYQVTDHPLCYTGAGRDKLFLEFPQNESPTYFGKLPPVLYVKDGVVVGMDIFTNGVIGQAMAFEALEKKFGATTYKATNKVTVLSGAQFDSIDAKWDAGNVSVIFNGTLSKSTDGIITIGIPGLNEVRAPKVARRDM